MEVNFPFIIRKKDGEYGFKKRKKFKYAFWISPWDTGESRGYTGGGGPGLNPCGIDIK